MHRRSFASAEHASKQKRTRREKLLAEMECIVPYTRVFAVIEPLHSTSGRLSRQPVDGPNLLRMYRLQQWCGLADGANGRSRRPSCQLSLPHRRCRLLVRPK